MLRNYIPAILGSTKLHVATGTIDDTEILSYIQPCELEKCSSYTYCGPKDKHPEYFTEMNRVKSAVKKKKDVSRQHNKSELEGINSFQSQSEYNFIKSLTPTTTKVNLKYKSNRPKLLQDIRILRKHFGCKIPE